MADEKIRDLEKQAENLIPQNRNAVYDPWGRFLEKAYILLKPHLDEEMVRLKIITY